MAVSYQDLINRNNTIFNKKTNVGYQNPDQLARDLGIASNQIQWGNIAKEAPAPVQQQAPIIPTAQQQPPVIPVATQQAPAAQQTPPVQYSDLVNKSGTIYNTQTNKGYTSPEELSKAMGLSNIDWNKIATAQPVPYTSLENQGGTIVNKTTGQGYQNPDELARDMGVKSDQIDWKQIAMPNQNVVEQPLDNTQTQQAPAQTAPAPIVSPEVIKAYNDAYALMQKAQELSPEELSTQADIDKLMESVKKGYEGTSNQAIPMEFITGQLKAVENRALGLMEPLEAKMARLQASRVGAIEASKTALEKAEKDLEYQRGQVSAYEKDQEDMRKWETEMEADLQKQANEYSKFEAELKEKSRQFDVGADLDYTQLLQKQQAEEREYALSEVKFEEDKRQFGLQYANEQRKTAINASQEARLGNEANKASEPKLTAVEKKNQAILELEDDIRQKMPTFNTREKLIEYLAPFYLELSKDEIAKKVYYIVGNDNKVNR